ncbi:MexE family multidrug efflux RND transporter periplasmic adaptor subunit [Planctomycetales bacterium]|nr:MexE family multidrug efflux RND transporter periplasmic adaptor subunit [Planctomycetales bacterium]GHT05550.1 MexE family multidrug efflux RND transporter periplasmic adaptor subunit [Planctomycetales bacterium]GHV20207.1 MexE family multidrug efflux RND transporter periplasmic adaptor subunit [Planctomycetales bacterium]
MSRYFAIVAALIFIAAARAADPTVAVMTVAEKPVEIIGEWIGTTDGKTNVAVNAQVSGYLTQQLYKEGAAVKRGDALFQLDDRTFTAQVNLARAQLKQAQAQQTVAEKEFVRAEDLLKKAVISVKEFEQKTGDKLVGEANVAVAQAQLDLAELNLGFTRITSSVNGVAGISQVRVGDLITAQTVMTTVSQVNPLRVYFAVSEQEYLKFIERAADLTGKAGANALKIDLILANGKIHPHPGEFVFFNRQIDAATGTMTVAADFDNPDNLLRPGMFARVRAPISADPKAILIPQRAVEQLQDVTRVATVDGAGKVTFKIVKAGRQIGADWLITDGLKAGEVVVVEGLQKIKDGMTVKTAPYAAAQATAK